MLYNLKFKPKLEYTITVLCKGSELNVFIKKITHWALTHNIRMKYKDVSKNLFFTTRVLKVYFTNSADMLAFKLKFMVGEYAI